MRFKSSRNTTVQIDKRETILVICSLKWHHISAMSKSGNSTVCFDSQAPHHWNHPDSKVHGANMGPTWVLSAPDGPHVRPMNLAIRAPITSYRFNNMESVPMSWCRHDNCQISPGSPHETDVHLLVVLNNPLYVSLMRLCVMNGLRVVRWYWLQLWNT